MAEGTRARVLEESVKSVHAEQSEMRNAIAALQQSINELIKRTDSSDSPKSIETKRTGESSNAGSSILGRHKPAPVYLARFNGDNPERWTAQASRYFVFYSIPEKDRLTISSFYLDESAADWFDWLQRNHHIDSWSSFTDALNKRFRSKELEEPEGLLAKLQQTSTVTDYRARFEAISNHTIPVSVPFLISCFISGLHADIKQSVIYISLLYWRMRWRRPNYMSKEFNLRKDWAELH